ncbi:MAG: NADAR family protein [Roseburia sp.]|nr:NADAR family protein [Roseburia sp.]
MIFFHNPEEENGYLSNWFMSQFEVDGVKFSSMEQYMMYKKAQLFQDDERMSGIMATCDVAEIKSLGRKVQGFDDDIWNENKYRIVKEGIKQKFVQNEELLEKLLSTGDEILAECAVRDTIWGIGLSMGDNRRTDKKQWKGKNLLGKALMEVRDELKS